MLGDIKGFCSLKTVDGVFIGYNKQSDPKGYAEIEKDLVEAPYLRIIDIGCDGSLLVLDPKGRCLCDVRDKNSIRSWFECSDFNGVILPPRLSFMEQLTESARRMTRTGGYGDLVRKMVIMTSLHYGKFTDDFLFACQRGDNSNSIQPEGTGINCMDCRYLYGRNNELVCSYFNEVNPFVTARCREAFKRKGGNS